MKNKELWIINTATFIFPHHNWPRPSCRRSRFLHRRWKAAAHKGRYRTESVPADIWIRLFWEEISSTSQTGWLESSNAEGVHWSVQNSVRSEVETCLAPKHKHTADGKHQNRDSPPLRFNQNSHQNLSVQKYTIIIRKENVEDILECLNFKRSGSERHSRQSAGSSDPSPQSSTVSHFHQKGIHSSVPQRNCWCRGMREKKKAADEFDFRMSNLTS